MKSEVPKKFIIRACPKGAKNQPEMGRPEHTTVTHVFIQIDQVIISSASSLTPSDHTPSTMGCGQKGAQMQIKGGNQW